MNQHNAYPDQSTDMPMPLHEAMRVVEEHLTEASGGQWSHWSDVKTAAENVKTAEEEGGGDPLSQTVKKLSRMHLAAVEAEAKQSHHPEP